ncbi:MAG: hypothetical protein ACT4OM_13165 [Actinomycetota bacterium]
MELVRWRWRPVTGVLGLAALMFWALVTIFGGSAQQASTFSPKSVDDPFPVPLQFPGLSQPLSEVVQALLPVAPESTAPPIEANTAASARNSSGAPTNRVLPRPAVSPPAALADSAPGIDPTIGPGAVNAGTRSGDPVGNLDGGFEDPSTFGPDEPEAAVSAPAAVLDPQPAQPAIQSVADRIRSRDPNQTSGNHGTNGASEVKSDNGKSEEGEAG